MSVFVVDTNKTPLTPCHEAKARKLLGPLHIRAYGHGCRHVQNHDKNGFPIGKPKQSKVFHGFQTGDIVKVTRPAHLKNAGVSVGRIAACETGNFKYSRKDGTRFDTSYNYCQAVHQMDGYSYQRGEPCA